VSLPPALVLESGWPLLFCDGQHTIIFLCPSQIVSLIGLKLVSGEVGKGGVMWGGVGWAVRTQRFLDVFEPGKGEGRGGPYGR
jgi:hypothetical protein